MPVLISKRQPIDGRFSAPASKPETQRAVLFAALADGASTIEGALASRETRAMIEASRALGASIEVTGDTIRVAGVGGELARHAGRTSYIWASGSALVARIFSVVGAAVPQRVIIDGNCVLRARPFAPLFGQLERHGVRFNYFDRTGCLPCSPLTHELPGGRYSLPTSISSQFATALLAGAPLARRATELELTGEHYSLPYILQTVDMLRRYGVAVRVGAGTREIVIEGDVGFRPRRLGLTGDYTSASYVMGAAFTTRGRVEIANLDPESLQGERAMVEIMQGLGARVAWLPNGALGIDCRQLPDEVDAAFDLRQSPNILPTVAALAATVRGRVRITGARLTQFHKSPRVEVMARELAKAGVTVTVLRDLDGVPDGMQIRGATAHPGHVTFASSGDHRIFMALALFALACERPCGFSDSHDTADSFPDFLAVLGLGERRPQAETSSHRVQVPA